MFPDMWWWPHFSVPLDMFLNYTDYGILPSDDVIWCHHSEVGGTTYHNLCDPSFPLEACTFCTVCSLSSCPVTQLSLLLLGTVGRLWMMWKHEWRTVYYMPHTDMHACMHARTYTHLQFVHMPLLLQKCWHQLEIFSRFSGQGSFSISW